LLWAGTWLGLGYFFSDAVSSIALTAARLGRMLGVVVLAAAGAYVLVRYLRRRVSLRTFQLVPDVSEPVKKMPDPILARALDGVGCDPDQARHDGPRDDTPRGAAARPAARPLAARIQRRADHVVAAVPAWVMGDPVVLAAPACALTGESRESP